MSLLHRTRHEDRTGDTAVLDRPAEPVDARDDRDAHVLARDEVATSRADEATIRERTWTFAPGQLISLAIGVGFVAIGLVAMVRAGIDDTFADPVVEVLGFSHTAWLGLAEVGLGVLLVLAGTGAWGRPLSVLLGAGMVIAGVLVAAEPAGMPDELGLEQDFGWVLIVSGAIVALASMALPVWRKHRIWRNDVDTDRRSTVDTH
jgi:hypothetical protein